MILAPAWRLSVLLPLLLLGSAPQAFAASDQESAALQSLQEAIYYIDGNGNEVQGIPGWPSDMAGYSVCNLPEIGCTSGNITDLLLHGKNLYNNKPLNALNDLINLQHM
eukprot:jgi/Chlat1/345/Chrsp10S01520